MNQRIHHHLSKIDWLYAKLELARYLAPRDMDHENIPEKRRQCGPSDCRRDQRKDLTLCTMLSNEPDELVELTDAAFEKLTFGKPLPYFQQP